MNLIYIQLGCVMISTLISIVTNIEMLMGRDDYDNGGNRDDNDNNRH